LHEKRLGRRLHRLGARHVACDGSKRQGAEDKKGVSVALVNLLNVRPGCTSNPAPVAVPVVRQKPANGTVQLLIVISDAAATDNCAARKVPAVAVIYTPKEGFAGIDSVGIEIEGGNRTTVLRYRVSVIEPGESL